MQRGKEHKLRIIAGMLRGRFIDAPSTQDIRPTADKIRGALFSMIQFQVPGAKVLDLYSGSGALGIEAISRGASFCLFCDSDATAIETITQNLAKLPLPAPYDIRKEDAEFCLSRLLKKGMSFDIVLADPPYQSEEDKIVLRACAAGILDKNGILCIERPEREEPTTNDKLILDRTRIHGRTRLNLYRFK